MFHIDMESVVATRSEVAFLLTVTQLVRTQTNSKQFNLQWPAGDTLTDSLLEDTLTAQYLLRNAKEVQE